MSMAEGEEPPVRVPIQPILIGPALEAWAGGEDAAD